MPPSDAIRLLYICPFRVDGGIWSDGVSVCSEEASCMGSHLWCACTAVSTFHQGGSWTHDVEHRRCDCGGVVDCVMGERKEMSFVSLINNDDIAIFLVGNGERFRFYL